MGLCCLLAHVAGAWRSLQLVPAPDVHALPHSLMEYTPQVWPAATQLVALAASARHRTRSGSIHSELAYTASSQNREQSYLLHILAARTAFEGSRHSCCPLPLHVRTLRCVKISWALKLTRCWCGLVYNSGCSRGKKCSDMPTKSIYCTLIFEKVCSLQAATTVYSRPKSFHHAALVASQHIPSIASGNHLEVCKLCLFSTPSG